MTLTKKKRHTTDPFASREADKYENPVVSREYILELLEFSEGPMTHPQLCQLLKLDDENKIEALRRRLIAMVRDGQLVSNRKGAFGRVDKMDLVKGRVLAHREGYGFVRSAEGGDDIYLSNRQMRKVFDGDEVLVRRGPKNFRGQIDGAIVEVLQRNTTELAGQLVVDRGWAYVRADNPKIQHDISIEPDKLNGAKPGQIVVVEITAQPDRNQRPTGVIKEVLGDHLAPGMEIDVAMRSHNIPFQWPEDVLQQSRKFGAEVREEDKVDRIDLRQLPFVTIDGEDARDFDDAVYCEKKRSGGWRLFVAIADVSSYVEPDSALDIEAQKRGNSVYFPNHVVPMLPEALSNGLCSLNPDVDRLCMVCEMTISAAGRISGYHFYEAVIHSHARLTYTKVGKMIEGRNSKRNAMRREYAHIISHIDSLYELFLTLKNMRATRGAIEFETTETRIEFDENRKISQIVPVHRNDAHRLIEECMLAANVCAAKFLEQHDLPGLFRVHDVPKAEKLELLQNFLRGVGLSLPVGEQVQPADFQKILASIEGRADAHIIQTVMLRSMNQAVYQGNNVGHFGLAYTAYAHFTSPIRRYPDLLVHRAIRSVIRSQAVSNKVKRVESANAIPTIKIYPYGEGQIEAFGEQCSFTERRADEATRDVVSWLKCEYLQEHVGDVFPGVISAVTGFGLFVELKDLYVEGLIHITSLPQDYYRHMPAQHKLIGDRTKAAFKLGDRVLVKVVRVSLDERKIDFELEEKKTRKSKSRASAKNAQAQTKKVKDSANADNTKAPAKRVPRKRPVNEAAEDTPQTEKASGSSKKQQSATKKSQSVKTASAKASPKKKHAKKVAKKKTDSVDKKTKKTQSKKKNSKKVSKKNKRS